MQQSVVLIPGMMLDGRMFADQIEALQPAYAVDVADLSHGDSIAAMAENALAAAPPRFALVGLSLGGIVALEVFRQARERITHLALLDTTPHADLPERSALRLEQMAAVERGDLAHILKNSMKPLYLSRRHRAMPALLERILQMGLDLGPEVFRRQSSALRTRRSSFDLLRSIDCPALVLCGREDQLCSVQVHSDMAGEIPQADLVVLAQTGHLSPMEEPAGVTASLLRLLQRSR